MLGLIAIVKESEEPSNTDQIKARNAQQKVWIRLDTIEDILFHNTRMDVVNEEIDFKELVEKQP
jgi:hypothetical protein